MLLLNKKVILVTGARRGIGRAICEVFAREGGVVYAGVRDKGMNNITLEPEEKDGVGSASYIYCDVRNSDSIKECIDTIRKNESRLDILVNNAGVVEAHRFEMLSLDVVRNIYETNVFGLMNVTQTAIRLLRKSDTPVIVNISSVLYQDGDIGQSAYASSKAAVANLTKTWAKELTPKGFRVNAIAPGNVDTDMFNTIGEKGLELALERTAMGRLAKSDEIANVALFLASDMSSYITGEIINVDGGLVP